jgi:hypothetical protein
MFLFPTFAASVSASEELALTHILKNKEFNENIHKNRITLT